jgi:hypothetical protein
MIVTALKNTEEKINPIKKLNFVFNFVEQSGGGVSKKGYISL